MDQNRSQTSSIKYTGGVRSEGGTGAIKKFDNPKDAYNDLYKDIHSKFNGGSSWVKPSTTLKEYISKFAPKEDNNDPDSYTNTVLKYLNSRLNSTGSKTTIKENTSLNDIKNSLINAGLDPEHEITKAHLQLEDRKVFNWANDKSQEIDKAANQPVNQATQVVKKPETVTESTSKKEINLPTMKVNHLPEVEKQPATQIITEAAYKPKIIEPTKPTVKPTTKPVIKSSAKPEVAKSLKVEDKEEPSELKQLIMSDVPLTQKIMTINNGIQRKLIDQPTQRLVSYFEELFSDPVKYPDAAVSKAKKEYALNQIKMLKDETFRQQKINESNKYFKELPDLKHNDQYNLDKLTFDYRNKGNKKEVKTRGIVLQTINPITEDKNSFTYGPNQKIIALDKNTGKIYFPNSKEEIKNNSAFTKANYYTVTDFDASKKVKDTKNGTGTYFPTLIDENGKELIYQVGASYNDNTKYGGSYGGKLLVISEDGKHKQLFVGSVAKLQKDFYKFKDKTNSKKVTVIQLDEGSFNQVKIPTNGKMTKSDWDAYESRNVSGSHAFYITN